MNCHLNIKQNCLLWVYKDQKDLWASIQTCYLLVSINLILPRLGIHILDFQVAYLEYDPVGICLNFLIIPSPQKRTQMIICIVGLHWHLFVLGVYLLCFTVNFCSNFLLFLTSYFPTLVQYPIKINISNYICIFHASLGNTFLNKSKFMML